MFLSPIPKLTMFERNLFLLKSFYTSNEELCLKTLFGRNPIVDDGVFPSSGVAISSTS